MVRRTIPMILGLASLVGASLACGGPRRGPGEAPTAAAQITQPAATDMPPTDAPPATATPAPTEAPTTTAAPTDTALPEPTATAAPPVTATNPPDELGERVEGLLDQFDQESSTAEAELNELPAVP